MQIKPERFHIELTPLGHLFVSTYGHAKVKRQKVYIHMSLPENKSLFAFRLMADGLPFPIWVHDADGRLQFVNQTYCEYFGVTPAQVLADGWMPLIHPDDAPAYVNSFKEAVYRQVPWDYKARVRGSAGKEWRWVHSHARPHFADDGSFLGVVGCSPDVTEQVEAQNRLKAAEQRLRLATEAAGIGIWEWHLPSGQLKWDTEMFHIYGVPPTPDAEVPYTTWSAAVLPEDLARQEAVMQDMIRSGGTGTRSFRIRRADDGEIRFLEAVETVRFNAEGEPEWVLGTNIDVTERRMAEEDLARSERFARSVVEASADCVKGLTLDGRLEWMNRNGMQLMELCDLNSFKGRDWTGFWEAGGGRAAAEAALEAARSGGVGRFRGECPTAAGTPRWWDVAITPIPGSEGIAEQLLCVSRDVTASRAAEQTIQESEFFYRQTLESIPGMVFTSTAEGARDYVSEQWVRFTGIPAADHLGAGWLNVLHPDDRSRVAAAWQAALTGQGRSDLEYRVQRSDGTFGWFKAHARAIRDADGAIARWFGTAVSIDDLKAAEARLVARERELQTLTDNSPDILTRFDRDLRHVFVNAAIERVTGRSPAEIIGKTNRELDMPPHLCAQWETALRLVFERGESATLEFTYQALAGERHFAARLVPEFGLDGAVDFVLGVTHDITERKRFEQALAEQDQRKDEFLATLAHELRNPLAPLRNGVSILQLSGAVPVGGAPHRTLGMMDRQLAHLAHLVDDLLDVARVSRGKISLKQERMPVRAAVEAAVEACRPTVEAKSHTLVVDLPEEPVIVDADRNRLAQVLGNLITNAAKYTEAGGQITVALRRTAREAVVTVSDTGVGIPPELMPSLWNMFTQVRDTLDKAQGGLGIGLSLVKNLVELHGGTVRAESAGEGRGSTFTVCLPLATEAGEPAAVCLSTEPQSVEQPNHRVLVLDDNEDVAESLAMLLELSGHETALAHSGAAALETARRFLPDIAFLDIGLPGMDGYEVARRLRADPSTAGTLLVALTGWGSAEDKRKSKEAGFDFHLTKPVEAAALQEVFGRVSQTGRLGN